MSQFSTELKKNKYDYIIIGAGIFGLYASILLSKKKGVRIAIIEKDKSLFSRASYVNQARVHNGYHYPRSSETASKAANYYEKFINEFSYAINGTFKKIYAISSDYSKVSAQEYISFCKSIKLPIKNINKKDYFKEGKVEAVFETKEASFDYQLIKKQMKKIISNRNNITIFLNKFPEKIIQDVETYKITLNDETILYSPFVVNATYASVNQILDMANADKFKIKYELCEIILCKASSSLQGLGVTVMDGPFFSIMPFGKKKYHSLTSVSNTPHFVSYDDIPIFQCQSNNSKCDSRKLDNCNLCTNQQN